MALAAFLSLPVSAGAVSITNRDARDHKVAVISDGAKEEHVLKPGAVIDKVCEKGCVVRLDDSSNDEYQLEGSDVVAIEEGKIYYDGADASPVPSLAPSDKRLVPAR